jgi:hypothetical protein
MHVSITMAELLNRIQALEDEVRAAADENQQRFRYTLSRGRARFHRDAEREHRRLKVGVIPYLLHSRALAILTAPLVYSCFVPFVLLDAVVTLYQSVCFPVYGVPRVRRRAYLVFDRGRLQYLNAFERFNCIYCSYSNGLIAYVAEVAARTEQHWCPIKHAQQLRAPHSRYAKFLAYGDAESYRQKLEQMRRDFSDLNPPAEANRDASR